MNLDSALAEFTSRDWQTESDLDPLRIAMVGLGWWTREQAIPAVAESEFCETSALVSGSREKAESVAEEQVDDPAALTYEEFHDGDATEQYDAVYVATPNATHLDFTESAADLDKAVLCEKSMEATAERARRMVEACEDADVPLMVGYRLQADPAVRRARELLGEGAIGDPVFVHGHMSQRLLEMNPNPDQWRLDPDMTGPGTSVTDLGVYSVNTARFVLDSDPVAVSALADSESEGFEDVPDERATFQFRFGDGTLATCSASQNAHESSFLRVIGTEGELSLEPAFFDREGEGFALAVENERVELDHEPLNQMREEFDYFAHQIRTDGEIGPDGRHGLVDVETIEAIYEAAERGSVVAV